ncbi:hypothetical protein ES708_25000 [subsurface metagenome]
MLKEEKDEMNVEIYSQEREELKEKVELLLQKQKDIIKVLKVLAKSTDDIKKAVTALWGGAEEVGKGRVEDCVYSRAGYCEHPASAMAGRPESKEDTTKIKGRYYPAVSWPMCYMCSKYEVPPEQVASKQIKKGQSH